jgi:hypothetical protein
MAEYAFWLEHECSRPKRPPPNRLQGEEWYEKRISWIVELMDVMQVTADQIVESMIKIQITETRSEKVNCTSIIDHFQTSVERNRVEISGRLTSSQCPGLHMSSPDS